MHDYRLRFPNRFRWPERMILNWQWSSLNLNIFVDLIVLIRESIVDHELVAHLVILLFVIRNKGNLICFLED